MTSLSLIRSGNGDTFAGLGNFSVSLCGIDSGFTEFASKGIIAGSNSTSKFLVGSSECHVAESIYHLRLSRAFKHLYQKLVTQEVLSSCQEDEIEIAFIAAKRRWNDVVSFTCFGWMSFGILNYDEV